MQQPARRTSTSTAPVRTSSIARSGSGDNDYIDPPVPQKKALCLIFSATGEGKAQPLDSMVLAFTGFKRMGDLRLGELVAGRDGQWYPITGVFPQGSKNVYRVELTDGRSAECCGDHLWSIQTSDDRAKGSGFRTRTTSDMANDPLSREYLPSLAPIQWPVANLPVDPYLLGVILGDGTIGPSVRIHNPEDHILDEIRKRVHKTEEVVDSIDGDRCRMIRIRKRVHGNDKSYTSSSLVDLGLAGCRAAEKFVPPIYLDSSPEQRLQLLRGLCDTDGYVNNGTGIEFCTKSEQLCHDVLFLVRSLGGRATTRTKPASYTKNGRRVDCGVSHNIKFSMPTGVLPVSSPKHLKKWRPAKSRFLPRVKSVVLVGNKETQCISVAAPDGLYVTNDFIVTHNTTFGTRFVPGPVAYHDVDCRGFHACQEARSSGKVIRYLPLEYPKHIEAMDEKAAMAAAKVSVDKHWRNLEWSVRASERGDIRTITWDTGSELADLVNITFTGRPERRNDDYGASANMVKIELAKMIKIVRTEGQANLVILAHHKEVYESIGQTAGGKAKREATGKFTFRGPDVLAAGVDWAGHLRLVKTSVKARGSDKAKSHELEVTKSGVILPMLGSIWTEEQWDEYGPFAFACSMLYPDSDVSDWLE